MCGALLTCFILLGMTTRVCCTGQETPGEDPTITSEYAIAFVRGMQGNDTRGYLKASSCLKHLSAYSEESGRNQFPAVVTSQDMEDTYLPAFQAGVQLGNATGMMCSYNAETYGYGVFGPGSEAQFGAIPSCANKGVLTDLVKSKVSVCACVCARAHPAPTWFLGGVVLSVRVRWRTHSNP